MENSFDKTFQKKVEHLSDLPGEVRWTPEKGWNDYEKKYLTRSLSGRSVLIYLSSAAVLFLVIFLAILVPQNSRFNRKLISNNADTVRKVVLSENNRIWLNKKSSVEYPLKMNKKQNEFRVNGEAYFEITDPNGQEYVINANGAVILVENSTNLNIRARSDEDNVIITVVRGACKIMNETRQNGLALLVAEGNYCSVHKSQNLVYSSANTNNNFLAWKTGKLVFDSTPIATVTDILSEYYNVQFELENKKLAYCLFSGTFDKDPFDKVLIQIETELDVVISNTGNKITISGTGCL